MTQYSDCEVFKPGERQVLPSMVSIPAGTFLMGSPMKEPGRYSDEGPQHEVTLEAFQMSETPITQAQWKAVMDNNPSHFKGEQRPVERVSWYDAMEFCRRLSEITGKNYTLPSEAQWEYACRAGTTTPFYFGATITQGQVNYGGSQTTRVGKYPANAWGLYDMHGNVWEWCLDDWHGSYEGAPTNGSAWVEDEGLGKSSEVARWATPPGSAVLPTASPSTRTPAPAASGSASAADKSLGKCSEAARGASTPMTAAQPSATTPGQTMPSASLGSALPAEGESLGKSSGVARGTTTPGTAARPSASTTTRTTAATASVSASVAEDASLGKCSEAARGTAPPGTAVRPSATTTARSAATTTSGSASAAEDASLGKSLGAARGTATPGTAARPTATTAARASATASSGSASAASPFKLLRGGSWNFPPGCCRSASRSFDLPDNRYNLIGFRVCCLPQDSSLNAESINPSALAANIFPFPHDVKVTKCVFYYSLEACRMGGTTVSIVFESKHEIMLPNVPFFFVWSTGAWRGLLTEELPSEGGFRYHIEAQSMANLQDLAELLKLNIHA